MLGNIFQLEKTGGHFTAFQTGHEPPRRPLPSARACLSLCRLHQLQRQRTDLHLLEKAQEKTGVVTREEKKEGFGCMAVDAQREFLKEEEGKEF
jgi:hypothetical protein